MSVAPWLSFRSALRSRWLLWLGLAVLVGATAGGVMAGFAGARRTASAYDRFLDRHRAYDVLIDLDCGAPPAPDAPPGLPDTSCLDDVERLPSVADLALVSQFDGFIATADGRSLQPDPDDSCFSGPGHVVVLGDRPGHFGTELNEIRIVAGRRADPAAADEVVLSKATADRLGLAPGSILRLSIFEAECYDESRWRAPISLRVVGIGLAPGEVPPPSGEWFASVQVTPAFVTAHEPPQSTPSQMAIPVRLRAGVDAEALLTEISGIGARAQVAVDLNDMGEAVERGIRVQAIALALVAALGALAGAAILGQVLVRQSYTDTADRRLLAALGMSSRGQFAVAMLPAIFVAVLTGAIAAVVAVAASPLTPIGLAREIEPDRGVTIDAVVTGVGVVSTVAFVLSVMAVAASWLSRRTSKSTGAMRRRPMAVVARMARAGVPPTVVSGVRMALERGTGRAAVPARTSVGAIAVAVFVVVGSLTFGAGLTHLLDTPRLTGLNWDAFASYPTASGIAGGNVPIERNRIEAALAEHPGVTAFAAGTVFNPFPEGPRLELGSQRHPVAVLSFTGTGEVGPSVIRGRAPVAPDEVLVGPETLDDLGLALGDTVEAYAQAGSSVAGEETSMRVEIVGIGVIPIGGRLGRGATLTLDGMIRLNPQRGPDGFWLRLSEPSEAGAVVADVFRELKAAPPDLFVDQSFFDEVGGVHDLEQVDRVPQLFASVMGVMALGVIAHVLVSGLRANRRDLAVMRALGFRRGDVARAVAWQSIVYVLAALAAGGPLGVVVGRISWRLYAERLGAVPEPIVPWSGLGLVAVAALTIAGIVGLALSRRATSERPASALRSE